MLFLEKNAQKIRKLLKRFPTFQSIFYFLYRLIFIPNSIKRLRLGFCSLCGKKTIMLIDSYHLSDTGFCLFCSANTRYRYVAEIIKKLILIKSIFKDLDKISLEKLIEKINLHRYQLKNILELIKLKNFWIYEPSSIGAIYNTLRNYPKFIYSEYFPYPNLKKGQFFGDTRFEDLQSLSFKDNSFDLLVTQDILEHVENPSLAFKEIFRVLKPNGIHIFTVPIGNNKKTFRYFDDKGMPLLNRVVFHKDPLRPEGAKVYTQFGSDIIDILNNFNFLSFISYSKINPKFGIFGRMQVIISIKKNKKQ